MHVRTSETTDGEDPTHPNRKVPSEFDGIVRATQQAEAEGSFRGMEALAEGRTGTQDALLTQQEFYGERGAMWVTLKERGLRFLESRGLSRLRRDRSGSIMVEYAVLVGAVGLAGSVGLVLVGAAVARNFAFVRSMLLCPIP